MLKIYGGIKGLLIVILYLLCIGYTNANYIEYVKTFIPKNSYIYAPILAIQVNDYFSDVPVHYYFGGLVEQESCIALTWNSCWNPKVQLLTRREQGAGLGQLTRAFYPDGKIRFDSLEAIRAKHFEELRNLSWGNILTRPDLQIRAIVLMSKDNWKRLYIIKDPIDRIAFMDAAYNGGLGGVYSDRRLCNLKADCDPGKWFGNVERTCSKSKIAIYGHQSPCSINRDHVSNVLLLRMKKYSKFIN